MCDFRTSVNVCLLKGSSLYMLQEADLETESERESDDTKRHERGEGSIENNRKSSNTVS